MLSPEMDFPPRNVKGIDHKAFAIHVGPNKVMFIPKNGKGLHYTLHIGVRPGVADLHETWTDQDGIERHKTLFAMKQSDLGPLLQGLGRDSVEKLVGIIRKLRVGWMYHRKIGIIIGLIPTDQQLSAITKLVKRNRLRLDEQAFLSNIRAPKFLEELFNEPDGMFTLVTVKRGTPKQIGYGYKVTLPTGEPRLFWVKKSDLLTEMEHLEDQLLQAACRFAIPPADYPKYEL